MTRERIAIQRVGEERLSRHRFLARQAAAELLVQLELLRAPLDFLFAVIGAEKDELPRGVLHTGRIENLFQRKPRPAPVSR